MKLTPAIKGQLTKAYNGNKNFSFQAQYYGAMAVLTKYMPRQQAKHAAKRYIATRISLA